MRRYHPDRNPLPTGDARVRAITAAYAVLGAADRRADYDLERTRLAAAERQAFVPEPQKRLAPFLAASFGLALAVLLVPLLVPPPLTAEQSVPASNAGGRQEAVPLEQDHPAATSNAGQLRRSDDVRTIASHSAERGTVSTLASVAQLPPQTTGQPDVRAAVENARTQSTPNVDQGSAAARPLEVAVAREPRIQPRPERLQAQPAAHTRKTAPVAAEAKAPTAQQPKPAWQQPMWQRPLPQPPTQAVRQEPPPPATASR